MEKQFLGDGVYADAQNGMVQLTTSDGESDTNTIWLEPEVVTALIGYLRKAQDEYDFKREGEQ